MDIRHNSLLCFRKALDRKTIVLWMSDGNPFVKKWGESPLASSVKIPNAPHLSKKLCLTLLVARLSTIFTPPTAKSCRPDADPADGSLSVRFAIT